MKKTKQQIVLIGGGGHCKVIADAVRKTGDFTIAGIVDRPGSAPDIFGIKLLGTDDDLERIYKDICKNAFIAVGSVGDPSVRVRISEKTTSIGFDLPVIIHPSAVIAENVMLKPGVFVGPGAVIGPGVTIGKNAIINTNSSVDHDCVIGDFVHIAPGATLSGMVEIGSHTHIGSGASVIEARKIGASSMIGAGSVVVEDIPAQCKAHGNPCKVV